VSAEPTEHKYAVIVSALQHRIEHGTYPVGSLLPSEADLVREFSASRSTVVRALEFLRQRGWLEGRQGKGRVVLGRPAPPLPLVPARLGQLLAAEQADVRLLRVGAVPAPARIAAMLGLPVKARIVARRRLVAGDRGPTALEILYTTTDIARGTGLGLTAPLPDGLIPRLERHGASPGQLAEQLSARAPSTQEALLLQIGRRDCLLSILAVVRDRAARPLIVIDSAVAASRSAVEASYALT
jgi:GntR family transcriptional regulator